MRSTLLPLTLATVLVSCTSSSAGLVVSGSVAGLPVNIVVSAATELCIARGGSALTGKNHTVSCLLQGRKIAFAISGNEPALTLDVVSLDARTSEADLKTLRDGVLTILSN